MDQIITSLDTAQNLTLGERRAQLRHDLEDILEGAPDDAIGAVTSYPVLHKEAGKHLFYKREQLDEAIDALMTLCDDEIYDIYPRQTSLKKRPGLYKRGKEAETYGGNRSWVEIDIYKEGMSLERVAEKKRALLNYLVDEFDYEPSRSSVQELTHCKGMSKAVCMTIWHVSKVSEFVKELLQHADTERFIFSAEEHKRAEGMSPFAVEVPSDSKRCILSQANRLGLTSFPKHTNEAITSAQYQILHT
jgi:hypothetical protein